MKDLTAVQPMPFIVSFKTEPSTIYFGATSTLSWQVLSASTVKLSPDNTIVAPTGTLNVYPSGTTSYKLEATNDAGTVSATITVTVIYSVPEPPPPPPPTRR